MTTFALPKKTGLVAVIAFGITTSSFGQQVKSRGAVVELNTSDQASQAAAGLDFANAKAMPIPNPGVRPPSASESLLEAPNINLGPSDSSAGGAGSGKQAAVRLAPEAINSINQQDQLEPQEFGISTQVFTTSRVNALGDNTQYHYAFRPTGKLFFKVGTGTATCSASLIKPGVVVTAAHCVANFGKKQFYSGWVFAPAYSNGVAPYGAWTVASVYVLPSYYNGTDSCAVSGVVCQDDVAVLRLAPQNGAYAGQATGYYGFGWNGWGFNASKQVFISQLGYPAGLDNGLYMERNDSQGSVSASFSNNTIIGSLMTPGSSGGPWLANLGIAPVLNGTTAGTYSHHNMVVGVTSWGYTDPAAKQQGAAPFTSGNIVPLVNSACSATPNPC